MRETKRSTEWLTAGLVTVLPWLTAAALVPFLYINVFKDDAPARLTLDADPPATAASAPAATSPPPVGTDPAPATTGAPASDASIDGAWTVTGGDNLVGYRVVEVLFGQDTEGVGRTSDVTGEMAIAGTQVTSATFTADMTTVQSDEDRRDNQFHNRLLSTDEFPTATFELTAPIELGAIPADGATITVPATGNLTLRGTTQPVTIELQARRSAETIQVVGSTDVAFADYGIPLPDAPGITTQDHGLLEFDLRFAFGLMDDIRAAVRVGQGVVIPASELTWRFSRSSGAGGQHVNTTDSRVELSWDLASSAALTGQQRSLARRRLGPSLVDGVLTVAASSRRSQLRNREEAIERLRDTVAAAIAPPPPSRRATRPTRGSTQRRLDAKRRRGDTKRLRQRPPD